MIQLPNYNNDKRAVITRLLMLIKPGKAADWATPQLKKLISSRTEAIDTLQKFGDTFEKALSDLDSARSSARLLETLKQMGNISDYNLEFKNLCMDLDWNKSTLMSQYECGLQHWVKQQLALKDPQPTDLSSLQSAAMKISNIFKELDASRPPKVSTSSNHKGKGRDTPTSTPTSTPSRPPNPNYVNAKE